MRVAVVAMVLLMTVSARAQTATDPATAQARQLYTQGITHYDLGEYKQALASFTDAYRVKRDAALLFNIAQCQRQLAQYEEAARSYRAFLRNSPDTPNRAEVSKLIDQMDAAAAQQRASAPPTGTQPMTTPPPSAAHRVSKPAPTATPVSERGNLREGRTLKIAGIAVGAVGLAALATGIAFAVLGQSAFNEINAPSSGYVFNPLTEDAIGTDRALGGAFLAIGGAAVVAGATMIIVGVRRERAARLAFLPALSPSTVGASVRLRF